MPFGGPSPKAIHDSILEILDYVNFGEFNRPEYWCIWERQEHREILLINGVPLQLHADFAHIDIDIYKN